jgi:type IV pilus assembly protein PilC
MGGELPWLTKVIINFSESFGSFLIVLAFIIIPLIIFHILNKKKERYQKFRDRLLIRIPIFGSLLLKSYVLRMVQSMNLLISSKVPITEALELSQRMVRFHPISSSLDGVKNSILQGKSINESMAQYSVYDSRLIALIKVGEETNQLGLIFNKISLQMEEELAHKAKMLGNTMEPIIIVFLGIIVALILVAMYMPMFELSSSFG